MGDSKSKILEEIESGLRHNWKVWPEIRERTLLDTTSIVTGRKTECLGTKPVGVEKLKMRLYLSGCIYFSL